MHVDCVARLKREERKWEAKINVFRHNYGKIKIINYLYDLIYQCGLVVLVHMCAAQTIHTDTHTQMSLTISIMGVIPIVFMFTIQRVWRHCRKSCMRCVCLFLLVLPLSLNSFVYRKMFISVSVYSIYSIYSIRTWLSIWL